MADKLQYSSQLFESLAIKWGTEWSYRIAEIIGTVQRQDQQNIIFSIWQSNGKNLIKHGQQNIKWFSITVCLPRFFDFPTAQQRLPSKIIKSGFIWIKFGQSVF